jgi:hypothetical protein
MFLRLNWVVTISRKIICKMINLVFFRALLYIHLNSLLPLMCEKGEI